MDEHGRGESCPYGDGVHALTACPQERLLRLRERGLITRADYQQELRRLKRMVTFSPPPTEQRRPFTKAQQYEILLRQASKGADDIWRAGCAGDGCTKQIAFLDADGRWKKLAPFDFDHIHERGMGGETSAKNGQALCSGPGSCHAAKTRSGAAVQAKAERQGGRTGQYARRAARKAKGLGPSMRNNRP